MKLNKIISVIAAIAMLSTSFVSVNAAVEVYDDGDAVVVKSIPTPEEVAERTPKLDVKIEELKTWTEVKDGLNKGFANKTKDAENPDVAGGMDVYKMTLTFKDLGQLVNGLYEDWDDTTRAVGIQTIGLTFFTDLIDADYSYMKAKQVTGLLNDAKYEAPVEAFPKGKFNIKAYNTADPYPSWSDGDAVYYENGELVYVVGVAFEAGTTLTFSESNGDYASEMAYYVYDGETPVTVPVKLDAPDTIEFAPSTPVPPVLEDIVIGARKGLTSGFAWDVTINNYAPAATYTATFTATGETDKVNDFDFTGVAEATEGASFGFAALLKTTKANVELAIAKN